MRYLIVLIFVFSFLTPEPVLASTGHGTEPLEYAVGLDDMPLMPGLYALQDEGVVFDQPDGRFVESLAVGKVPAGAVHDFYSAVLPQLGWQLKTSGSYTRDGESLILEIESVDSQTRVRFTVSPDQG